MKAVPTETLQRLAQVAPSPLPVISVYLHTRADDEHQRDRVRIFLKNESRRLAAMAAGATEVELAWIAEQGERIVAQQLYPAAEAVALFAGGAAGLRETIPLAVPVDNSFAVADTPCLRPLVTALAETPRTLVIFIDGERARIITVRDDGATDEVALQHPDMVVGHHRRGGWALLLQSKYDKHMRVHRDRHFEAVADALTATVARYGITTAVLAGEPRIRAVFRPHLPPPVAKAVVGEIAGAQYESASALAARAREVVRVMAESEQAASVDAVLSQAEGGGRAAAGIDRTMDATNRGTVERLYLLHDVVEAGAVCTACSALQRVHAGTCRWCGNRTQEVELGEAMVRRALATAGAVEIVRVHAGLAAAGGVAALLRYAP